MVNTVNKIPSINLPFTNEQGVIHPIWYEFLRSFIESTDQSLGGSEATDTATAGQGLFQVGSSLNVGQGAGLQVNDTDVEIDINGQINAQAKVEDEILMADASNGSAVRKTSLQDVANLSPGTSPGGNNSAVQYNKNGAFAGDNSFTTDGSGGVSVGGNLDLEGILKIADSNGDMTINGASFSTASSSDVFVFSVPASGDEEFTFTQTSSGAAMGFTINGTAGDVILSIDCAGDSLDTSQITFLQSGTEEWSLGTKNSTRNFALGTSQNLNSGTAFTIEASGLKFIHHAEVELEDSLLRNVTAGITASTTQTQGNGALTAEVNEVSTVGSDNDTVTLPTAQAGQKVWIFNNGSKTLQIFPASGDDLGSGADTATTLASGGTTTFIAYDATNWIQDA